MPAAPGPRSELRRRLLAAREQHAAAAGADAEQRFGQHLADAVAQLEPERLGLYWPMRSEFNAAAPLRADARLAGVALALPFTRRDPREMHFRAWDGQAPRLTDECNIATSDGAPVVPDVVLAPCVGFTAEGFRLGYGGGYFDRWMAAHPHVTVIGVAWSVGLLGAADYVPEPHDRPLAFIVTESGVVV